MNQTILLSKYADKIARWWRMRKVLQGSPFGFVPCTLKDGEFPRLRRQTRGPYGAPKFYDLIYWKEKNDIYTCLDGEKQEVWWEFKPGDKVLCESDHWLSPVTYHLYHGRDFELRVYKTLYA